MAGRPWSYLIRKMQKQKLVEFEKDMKKEKRENLLNVVQSWKNTKNAVHLETLDDYELLKRVNKMLN